MNSKRSRPAFTLLELLVVIAIIALLAGLILAALAGAKSRARATQCANNLRQWGIAYRQYADDNDDRLPRRGQGVKPLQQIDRPEDWFNALPPYLKLPTYQQFFTNNQRLTVTMPSVFVCPSATDPGSNHFLPYAMNMNLCPWGNSGESDPTKLSDVIRSAQVVTLIDGPGPYSATFPSQSPYAPVPRHVGKLNILFLLGSVQSFPGDYVGCNTGDPKREDVRWLTGTESDAGATKY